MPRTAHSPTRLIHDQRCRVFAQEVSKPRLGLLAKVGSAFGEWRAFFSYWGEGLSRAGAALWGNKVALPRAAGFLFMLLLVKNL